MQRDNVVEIWGGIEGTINRVGDAYHDQLEYSGHYQRDGDIDLVASLGIKKLRYPILWEKQQPMPGKKIDWQGVTKKLTRLRELGIEPIAGLVHHGSGPSYVNFFDGSFEKGLARYARQVATQFPWIEYYTPVNEPLTTARFCGLYGHWFPHGTCDYTFYKVLLSECRAVIMAMEEIHKVNPNAKLVQTEDLGKAYSTPLLKYQANFENRRRWLSYDLICGRVDQKHPLRRHLVKSGILPSELDYFLENNIKPFVCGFNYYPTSERYLDEDTGKYPPCYRGGNGRHRYADIHLSAVSINEKSGPYVLLKEAHAHLQLPIAVTECHLYSTREEQMRWLHGMWHVVNDLKREGVDIRALTAWALFGLHGWNKLCTEPWGTYEPGIFNLASGSPRPTALAALLKGLTSSGAYQHPVLESAGSWNRNARLSQLNTNVVSIQNGKHQPGCRPLLIIGEPGVLGDAFGRICSDRKIHYLPVPAGDLDGAGVETIERLVAELKPWAIVDAAGDRCIDEAESTAQDCIDRTGRRASMLAEACRRLGVKLVIFSSDQVFDGHKENAYLESDAKNPVNAYGKSRAAGETKALQHCPSTLVIRTGSLFGPWEECHPVSSILADLRQDKTIALTDDVYTSPVYLPDLVHETLNLLLDDESGVFHLVNEGRASWAEIGRMIARLAGCDESLVEARAQNQLGFRARRPYNSVLQSERGIRLPTLEDALQRYLQAVGTRYERGAIAV